MSEPCLTPGELLALANIPARLANVAGAITGPFFSRESADEHMRARRHAYGPKADVYCFSGHESDDWRAFCREPAPVTP